MTRLIDPNMHVVLIHLPLGLLGLGVLIELFSFLWRGTSIHLAARWMILLGTLGLLPAGTSGIYALADVMTHGRDGSDSWLQLKEDAGLSGPEWEQAKDHMLWNSVGTGLALLAVMTWLGASDKGRRVLYPFSLGALVWALAIITVSAWHGGELVFRHGFGVEGVRGVLQGDEIAGSSFRDHVDTSLSILQLHLVGAGLVFAAVFGAMGCATRRARRFAAIAAPRPVQQAADTMSASAPAIVPDRSKEIPLASWQPPRPGAKIAPPPAAVILPASRLWLLAVVLALGTAALGLWSAELFVRPGFLSWDSLRTAIHQIADSGERRVGLHIVMGGAIVLIALFLALVVRAVPRGRVALSFGGILLILLMAGQTYSGVLMLFDGDGGPITRFKDELPVGGPPPITPVQSSPTTGPSTQATTMPF